MGLLLKSNLISVSAFEPKNLDNYCAKLKFTFLLVFWCSSATRIYAKKVSVHKYNAQVGSNVAPHTDSVQVPCLALEGILSSVSYEYMTDALVTNLKRFFSVFHHH